MLVMPMVEAGQMKALAVTTLTRTALASHLPTMIESGFPGFEVNGWGGLLAPAATPKPILDQLYADVTQALADPDMKAKMALARIDPVGSSRQEFSDRIRAETAYWADLMKSANITLN
jgi:tripartite-type tricarboxylate transporter receptor subunit TctC